MNEKIKQRLVGAVVLVSLAVIFIPMLLDGGDSNAFSRFGSNIPAQPKYDYEPLEIPLQPLEPFSQEQPQVIDKADSDPALPIQEQASTAPSTTAAKPAASEVPAAKHTKSESKEEGEQLAWVVQVGSFSQSANALALRDRLRSNGFTAFVEKYRDAGKTSYRVRVGPELKRENAEKHLSQIKRKFNLNGIIMGHP